MPNYTVIRTHFDKIDLSKIDSTVDVLICFDPTDVDFKTEKEHLHDDFKGFRYGICVLNIKGLFPEILDIKVSYFDDAIKEVELLVYKRVLHIEKEKGTGEDADAWWKKIGHDEQMFMMMKYGFDNPFTPSRVTSEQVKNIYSIEKNNTK